VPPCATQTAAGWRDVVPLPTRPPLAHGIRRSPGPSPHRSTGGRRPTPARISMRPRRSEVSTNGRPYMRTDPITTGYMFSRSNVARGAQYRLPSVVATCRLSGTLTVSGQFNSTLHTLVCRI
jgi:hypothetical protein